MEEICFDLYLIDERLNHFRKRLTERIYPSKNSAANYRIINHWASMEIIEAAQLEPNGWRKFSVIDMAWIETVMELRKYGMPLEKIKKAYTSLFKNQLFPDVPEPIFEYNVFLALAKNPVSIVIFEDGFATSVGGSTDSLKELWEIEKTLTKQSCIVINLNSIVSKLFKRTNIDVQFPTLVKLTDKENAIVTMLRQGNYEEAKIIFRDKEPMLFEGKEIIGNNSEIEKVLREQDYQTIEVKTEQGKVVKFKRTIKKKI